MSTTKKILLGFSAVVLIAVFTLYYKMGAFNSVQISVVKAEETLICGVWYKGRESDERFTALMKKIDPKMGKEFPRASAYKKVPLEEDREVEVFIGAIVPDSSISFGEDFEHYYLPERKVVRGELNAATTFAYKPPNELIEYASDNNLYIRKNQEFAYTPYTGEKLIQKVILEYPIVEDL